MDLRLVTLAQAGRRRRVLGGCPRDQPGASMRSRTGSCATTTTPTTPAQQAIVASLARPAKPPRPGPVRGLGLSDPGQCLLPEAAARGRIMRSPGLGADPMAPDDASQSQTAISWSEASAVCRPISERCSSSSTTRNGAARDRRAPGRAARDGEVRSHAARKAHAGRPRSRRAPSRRSPAGMSQSGRLFTDDAVRSRARPLACGGSDHHARCVARTPRCGRSRSQRSGAGEVAWCVSAARRRSSRWVLRWRRIAAVVALGIGIGSVLPPAGTDASPTPEVSTTPAPSSGTFRCGRRAARLVHELRGRVRVASARIVGRTRDTLPFHSWGLGSGCDSDRPQPLVDDHQHRHGRRNSLRL